MEMQRSTVMSKTAGNNALINADVTGDAFADATDGNDAAIRGSVTGDATLVAEQDATLNADVTGSANITVGRNADASGAVTGSTVIEADQAIALGSEAALTVGETLTANADADGNGGADSTITQVNEVVVSGATTLSANEQSNVLLANAQNDFSTLAISDTAETTVTDANALDIASIDNATGDVALETINGRLTLQDTDYRIATNQGWMLTSTNGDIALDGRIDSEAGEAGTGSLTVVGGTGTTIRVKNLIGSQERLNDATFQDASNVILGLSTEGDFLSPQDNPIEDFLLQTGGREDIFFARSLDFNNIQERAVVLLPTA